jgi:hypothetical protein
MADKNKTVKLWIGLSYLSKNYTVTVDDKSLEAAKIFNDQPDHILSKAGLILNWMYSI